ncbi:MAG: asparagine synthase-related protein [Phormidesmis sp.]
MSGFAGLFCHDGESIDLSLLHQMVDSMAFRGPDAQAVWQSGAAGLGHALLKTADEQAQERQPMSLNQRVWISADVRLDGRDELIAKLRPYYAEVSADLPDVALVLRAYHVWDTDCVERLRGDFAFLIWDEVQQRLFAARDRFGIIPFFYSQTNNTLVCSNTLDCVRRYPGVSTELNEQAVADQLLQGMNLTYETTIFAGVRRLPPAHTLIWQTGELQVRSYWQLPRVLPLTLYQRPEEYVERFLELFEQAVSDRMRTGQIATHLSGGMDSTSIAAIAHKVLEGRSQAFDLQAFTARDRHTMPDEDSHAAMVAHYIGVPLNVVNTEGGHRHVPDLSPNRPLPQPAGGVSGMHNGTAMNQRCVSHARTVLTGFGGDPALRFGEFYWMEWLQQGLLGRLSKVQLDCLRTHRKPNLFLRRGWGYQKRIFRHRATLPPALSADFVARQQLEQRMIDKLASSKENISRYGMGHTAFWSNIFEGFDPGMTGIPLKHVYPFFDLKLVEYVMSIPPIPWLVNKRLLRDAMQGLLPDATRQRKKMVFQAADDYAPVMQQMVPVWIEDAVQQAPGLDRYVDTDELLRMLRSQDKTDTQRMMALEKSLGFAYWLRTSLQVKPFEPAADVSGKVSAAVAGRE